MNKIRGLILGFIVWIIYKIISSTWRTKISEPPEMRQEQNQKRGIILAHFHGDEIALISLAKKYKIATMTSTSKDGEIMNTTLNLLGAKTSRGSSTRGGIGALKGLIRLSKEGHSTSFAVDGPKGPLHGVKPGVFEFSRLTGANIYACGVFCDRAWHFPKSWNKTYFPKPCMLVPNIFTAMASNITPKNFLITIIPLGPSILSIQLSDFSTKKITIQFINIPIKILASL